MAESKDVERSSEDRSLKGRSRAAGIYGTIVTASVLATAGGQLRPVALEILVFSTLVVYWLAELYAEVLGQHVHAGRLPRGPELRGLLTSSWQLVAASYLPLVALAAGALAGMTPLNASFLALGVTVVLLLVHGLTSGRAAGLTGWRLAGGAATAGLFGLAMVVLKAAISH